MALTSIWGGGVDFYLTGVTEAEFERYCEEVLYTQLGANKDYDYVVRSYDYCRGSNNNGEEQSFYATYLVEGGKVYEVEVMFYRSPLPTNVIGTIFTSEANSMKIAFTFYNEN